MRKSGSNHGCVGAKAHPIPGPNPNPNRGLRDISGAQFQQARQLDEIVDLIRVE